MPIVSNQRRAKTTNVLGPRLIRSNKKPLFVLLKMNVASDNFDERLPIEPVYRFKKQ